MLFPGFVASVSPVMVQEIHQHRNKIKITTYGVDELNISDIPVYCKIKFRRKGPRLARATNQETGLQASAPDPTFQFPFLCDRRTRSLIQRSKTLFIMRGLPGSGKSTIVRAITGTYPSSVVCSADDYFLQDGVYKFDATGLQSAHAACQQKAEEACNAGVPVVVVDNTNVRRWEMKFYLALASNRDYVVVPVQPKTAWKLNAEELAMRNKHGVDVDVLRRKVTQFEDVIPLYYAWFLPTAASKQLVFIAQCLLQECAQTFPSFCDSFLKHMHVSRHEYQQSQELCDKNVMIAGLLKHYYTRGNRSGTMVHCTAKFCGGGRAVGAKTYHAMPAVQNSVGQCSTLQIHSICFSPRTVGARVQLSEQQLPLFDKPEEKDWNGVQTRSATARGAGANKMAARGKSDPQGSGKPSKSAKRRANTNSKQETEAPADDGDQSFSAVKQMEPRRTKPLAKTSGRSAHITIGCAQGFESRETNFDVLRLCDLEAGWRATDADFVPVTGGKARYFGDGVCCVYFDPPLFVRTVYSGFY